MKNRLITLILISFVACCPPCPAQTAPDAAQLRPAVKYTYKDLWRATKRKTGWFLKHCIPTAQNMNENWEAIKKTWRDSNPYVQPIAAGTGVFYNINNMKIRTGN